MSTIRILSKKKIEVIRALSYDDKTPDIAKAGTVIGTGNFLNVMTFDPVSYSFEEGVNVIPEPYTFRDPATRTEITESITEWPAVKSLIKNGVFEVFRNEQAYDYKAPAAKTTGTKGNKGKGGKGMPTGLSELSKKADEVAEDIIGEDIPEGK